MKFIMICFMLLLVCSCHDNIDKSMSNEPKETNRSEEILKIMREDSIHEIEVAEWKYISAELKEKILNEARKMKEDYNYVMDSNLPLTIAGPGWEIKGPLSFDNAPTKEFREKCKEGDELYFYKSDRKSWLYLRGREGYVIIRGNKKIDGIVTVMN